MASRGEHGRTFRQSGAEPGCAGRGRVVRFDTSRPVLLPLFGLNLPELRSLMLALDAELRTGGLGGSLLVESVANVLAVHLIRYITGPGRLKAAADRVLPRHKTFCGALA